jgi:hypothetical protein
MGGIAIRGSSRSVNVVDKLHDSANIYSANKQCMSIGTTPYEPRTSNDSFVGEGNRLCAHGTHVYTVVNDIGLILCRADISSTGDPVPSS